MPGPIFRHGPAVNFFDSSGISARLGPNIRYPADSRCDPRHYDGFCFATPIRLRHRDTAVSRPSPGISGTTSCPLLAGQGPAMRMERQRAADIAARQDVCRHLMRDIRFWTCVARSHLPVVRDARASSPEFAHWEQIFRRRKLPGKFSLAEGGLSADQPRGSRSLADWRLLDWSVGRRSVFPRFLVATSQTPRNRENLFSFSLSALLATMTQARQAPGRHDSRQRFRHTRQAASDKSARLTLERPFP